MKGIKKEGKGKRVKKTTTKRWRSQIANDKLAKAIRKNEKVRVERVDKMVKGVITVGDSSEVELFNEQGEY